MPRRLDRELAGSPAAGTVAAAILSVALAAGAPLSMASAADWGVEQLMRSLGEVKFSEARFVERKHMAILSAPLESSGTLVYRAPDRLEKHTRAPRQESLVLERDRLTIETPERKQRRTITLQDYPVIWAFVESIRSTLAGDLATLTSFYEVRLEGGAQRWRLLLRPRDPQMEEFVSEIRLSGGGNRINAIETIETNGDRSVMTITQDPP
ncbi:MAG TPA: LolA-related protein [Burkholderiales bacterium]|jgi:outer membrane lipoprotein-sorting protein